MICRLTKFAFVFLLGVLSAAGAAAEAALPGTAPLSSDLERLTLRQAEIFFAERNRELQFARRAVEGAEADIPAAATGLSPVRPMDFDK